MLRNLIRVILAFVVLCAGVLAWQAGRIRGFANGLQAYIYGYPLVMMDVTHDLLTAPRFMMSSFKPGDNVFNHVRAFPTPASTQVVAPNADTLYSIAWLDLSAEPVVMQVPDTAGRWYMMQLLDDWTNTFFVVGKRPTGTAAGDWAITGPGWTGTLPQGVKQIASPTTRVWIIGRVISNGPADHPNAHKVQDGLNILPLSKYGMAFEPPAYEGSIFTGVDFLTPPVQQVARMDAAAFFGRLAKAMKRTPPAADDGAMADKLAAMGIVPGQAFDPSRLDADTRAGIELAIEAVRTVFNIRAPGTQVGSNPSELMLWAATKANDFITRRSGAPVNGWNVPLNIGRYDTNYPLRAFVALAGLGANPPEDAVYPTTFVDASGEPLDGRKRYVLRFAKDALPPVDAFWSLTLYNGSRFFTFNPIDRYAIGDRDNLLYNADGSLDILIQNEAPGGEKDRNWLPSPLEPFNLTLRLYDPREPVLKGAWKPPVVQLVMQ